VKFCGLWDSSRFLRNFSSHQLLQEMSVVGKGNKDRWVLIPSAIYRELLALRQDAPIDSPMFTTSTDHTMDRSRVFRIVADAVVNARIEQKVPPHWMRHSRA
jgi:integrase/recombinase XerD